MTRIVIRVIILSVRGLTMKSYSSREVIQMLVADGWYEVGCDGDHHQFKHLTQKGRVTVTHPKKDIPIGTLKSIERQAGIKFS